MNPHHPRNEPLVERAGEPLVRIPGMEPDRPRPWFLVALVAALIGCAWFAGYARTEVQFQRHDAAIERAWGRAVR